MRLTNRGRAIVWFLVLTSVTLLNVYISATASVVEVVQYIPCAP